MLRAGTAIFDSRGRDPLTEGNRPAPEGAPPDGPAPGPPGPVPVSPVLVAPILVAIGANLPGADGATPLETCRRAAGALRGLPGLRLVALSRWYRTAPLPPSGQPDYVNGVARLEGEADPATLLAWLHDIERDHARARGAPNAARTLDLDLVAIGGLVRAAPDPDPVLPHPRAHGRRFVLAPLCDVAPDWMHPVLGRSAAALLAGLPEAGVTLLETDDRGG